MNTPNSEIKRFGIVILQSLPCNERQTGEELYKDLLQYKPIQDNRIFCDFIDVVNKSDFNYAISQILSKLQEGDLLTIHFETHGSVSGVALSSGEIIAWEEFYNIIRPLNIAVGHLLFIIMSMCCSIAMLSNIAIEQRAPYRAFICTTREMYPHELYEGFISFYEKFCNLLDVFKAMTALQKEIHDCNGFSPFQLFSAENVFDETLSTTRDIDEICINQLNRMEEPITLQNINKMRIQIRDIFTKLHSKYFDYYNFRDIY